MTIHINIGSNLGERKTLLYRAVNELMKLLPGEAKVSRPIETEPWGFSSDNPFLNIGVSITLPATQTPTPVDILHTLQDVERGIAPAPHRDSGGAYIDRPLDIDLIAIDTGNMADGCPSVSSLVIDTPELTLPHPRMHLRDFVLIPLSETAPSWHHPLLHLSPAEMLEALR